MTTRNKRWSVLWGTFVVSLIAMAVYRFWIADDPATTDPDSWFEGGYVLIAVLSIITFVVIVLMWRKVSNWWIRIASMLAVMFVFLLVLSSVSPETNKFLRETFSDFTDFFTFGLPDIGTAFLGLVTLIISVVIGAHALQKNWSSAGKWGIVLLAWLFAWVYLGEGLKSPIEKTEQAINHGVMPWEDDPLAPPRDCPKVMKVYKNDQKTCFLKKGESIKVILRSVPYFVEMSADVEDWCWDGRAVSSQWFSSKSPRPDQLIATRTGSHDGTTNTVTNLPFIDYSITVRVRHIRDATTTAVNQCS